MLKAIEGAEEVVNAIESKTERKERCKLLIDFITKPETKQKNEKKIKLFVTQLEKLDLQNVIDLLAKPKMSEDGKCLNCLFASTCYIFTKLYLLVSLDVSD